MINQLKQIIEQVSAQQNDVQGLSADTVKQVTEETGTSILSGFKSAVSSGNITQITDLFQGGTNNISSNPLVEGIVGTLVSSLTFKLGLSQGVSSSIAQTVVPKVLEILVSKSSNGESGFHVPELLASFGKEGDLGTRLGGLASGLTNGKGGEGAIDVLKGLFK